MKTNKLFIIIEAILVQMLVTSLFDAAIVASQGSNWSHWHFRMISAFCVSSALILGVAGTIHLGRLIREHHSL